MLLTSMASHNQTSHVASHFDHLDLNGMVSLMTLLVWCDTDTSTNGIALWNGYAAHCFSHLDLMNTRVLLTMLFASHDADASAKSVKCLKSHVASHFDYLELTNAIVL